MNGLIVLVLSSLASGAMTANYLTFLNLVHGPYKIVSKGSTTSSPAIYSSVPIGFGSQLYMNPAIYVSTNGRFSTRYSTISPFASSIDTSVTGFVIYQTYSTGDPNIESVNAYITSEIGVTFQGVWMLVADWFNVAENVATDGKRPLNRFQGVIITDGSTTFAAFLYSCPNIKWSGLFNKAQVGWQATDSHFRTHPLSGTVNVNEVACLNNASIYTTLLFKLSLVDNCSNSSYGCFDGGCVDSSLRCNGYSDCSDGSDEVACSDFDSFLSLSQYSTVRNGDSTFSGPIISTVPIRFGDRHSSVNTVYVATDGYFSLGVKPKRIAYHQFNSSTNHSIVAPFATNIHTISRSSLIYKTYTTGSLNIGKVSSLVRTELGVSFNGTWMLVASWRRVPANLKTGRRPTIFSPTNSFQAAIITDGSSSYTMFRYSCPFMEWTASAVIGWQASPYHYNNHPLSGRSFARDIACLNSTSSVKTVIFTLTRNDCRIDGDVPGCVDFSKDNQSKENTVLLVAVPISLVVLTCGLIFIIILMCLYCRKRLKNWFTSHVRGEANSHELVITAPSDSRPAPNLPHSTTNSNTLPPSISITNSTTPHSTTNSISAPRSTRTSRMREVLTHGAPHDVESHSVFRSSAPSTFTSAAQEQQDIPNKSDLDPRGAPPPYPAAGYKPYNAITPQPSAPPLPDYKESSTSFAIPVSSSFGAQPYPLPDATAPPLDTINLNFTENAHPTLESTQLPAQTQPSAVDGPTQPPTPPAVEPTLAYRYAAEYTVEVSSTTITGSRSNVYMFIPL